MIYMKSKHIALLLIASVLTFIPSCGVNSEPTTASQAFSEEDTLELVPFNNITFRMKKSWDYKCEKDGNDMLISCADSSFIDVSAVYIGYDLNEDELKQRCYFTDREASEITKFSDCNIYYYTYVPKTLKGLIHVYFFSENGYKYMIQAYQKEEPDTGVIYQNIDDILIQIRQNMIDYLN